MAYWDGEQNTPAVARTELLMEITNDESVAAVQHFDFQISGGSLRIEEFSNGNPDTTNPFEEADADTNGAKVSFEVQLDNVVLFSAYYSVWGAGGSYRTDGSGLSVTPVGDACRGYEPLFLRGRICGRSAVGVSGSWHLCRRADRVSDRDHDRRGSWSWRGT